MSKDQKKQRALTVSALDYLHDSPKTNVPPVELQSADEQAGEGQRGKEVAKTDIQPEESISSQKQKVNAQETKIQQKSNTAFITEKKDKPTQTVKAKNIEVPIIVQQEEEKGRGGRPKRPERKRFTLNVNKKYHALVQQGRLEEKFRTDSDFLDHIFETYFKNKPYNFE
ncbi:hypothetical protein [Xanthocytophaga flava]|uniref:hypothetical protein n=1 Tax=Xanthocytophaga flava TaxID=3048013 RepID=UPI0028D76189|nr:hypothetical protein [Xanthocytophaga flavus]MDJ1470279.1 hypothetical protein [Xanthocytophaga flavus]